MSATPSQALAAAGLLSMLGKSSDSPEVVAWLAQVGARPPKLGDGDFNTGLVLADEGLELTFTDEAKHHKRRDLAIGEGALLLTSVRFNSAEIPDFQAYAAALPFGVAFPMSQAQVQGVLGPPEFTNARLRLDRWTRDGWWVFAQYGKTSGTLSNFSVQALPPAS